MATTLDLIREQLQKNNETSKKISEVLNGYNVNPDAAEEAEDNRKLQNKDKKEISDNLKSIKEGFTSFAKSKDSSFLSIIGDNLLMMGGIAALSYVFNNRDTILGYFESFGNFLDDIGTIYDDVVKFVDNPTWKGFTDFFDKDGELMGVLGLLDEVLLAFAAIQTLGIFNDIGKEVQRNNRKRAAAEKRRIAQEEANRKRFQAQERIRAAEAAEQRRLRDAQQLEANRQRISMQDRIRAAELAQSNPRNMVQTDIGTIRYLDTGRYQNVDNGNRFISIDEATRAINATQAPRLTTPMLDTSITTSTAPAIRVPDKTGSVDGKAGDRVLRTAGYMLDPAGQFIEDVVEVSSRAALATESATLNVAGKIGLGTLRVLGSTTFLAAQLALMPTTAGDGTVTGLVSEPFIELNRAIIEGHSMPTILAHHARAKQMYEDYPDFQDYMNENFNAQAMVSLDENQLLELTREAYKRNNDGDMYPNDPILYAIDKLMDLEQIKMESDPSLRSLYNQSAEQRDDLLYQIISNQELSEDELLIYDQLLADGLFDIYMPHITTAVSNIHNNNITPHSQRLLKD